MPSTRRGALRSLAAGCALGTAGCVDRAIDPGASGDRTESPEPTPEYDCSTAERPDATEAHAPESGHVRPATYPDRPADDDSDSLAAYVRAYERAYVRNHALVRDWPLREFSLSFEDAKSGAAGDGRVVRVSYYYGYCSEEICADSPTTVAAYYADENALLRAETQTPEGITGDLDPREEGEVVECF